MLEPQGVQCLPGPGSAPLNSRVTASCVRQVHVVLHGRAKPKEGIAERSNKWQKAAVALESKGVLSPSPAKTSRGNLRRFLGRRGEPKDE